MMRAKFGLPSIEAEETVVGKRPPIRVKFEIPYFTVSGIQVNFALHLFVGKHFSCRFICFGTFEYVNPKFSLT